jgi:hydroxymethylglutaryl-CoA reductase
MLLDIDPGAISDFSSQATLSLEKANRMVENVIAVYGLPVGTGLNITVNGKDYIVPMVIEEASVIAAVSSSAKITRAAGGFRAEAESSMMIGQIQVVDVPNPEKAKQALLESKETILRIANSKDEVLCNLGGGAVDLEVRELSHPELNGQGAMLVLHIIVNTLDAMGANAINSMAEALAPIVENLTGGRVLLRILSNLADRRKARAWVHIPFSCLDCGKLSGRDIAERIVQASLFAEADPYRATTHNKGIMNGIDAVAIATGNDWRAIEAGAHAYAARNGQYAPLSRWRIVGEELHGVLELPLAVGIVGGSTRSHPLARIFLRLMRILSARELAELMAAVGLAQNLSALKALVTEGIQKGHMALHSKTVAIAAGAHDEAIELIARIMVREGKINIQRARELLKEITRKEHPRARTPVNG